MDQATLGGVQGAAEVRVRLRDETSREYRGVFAFAKEDEGKLVALLASRAEVDYVGPIEGRVLRLSARLTDLSLVYGLAYFQGLNDPLADSEPRVG